jgi:hypothetical protein
MGMLYHYPTYYLVKDTKIYTLNRIKVTVMPMAIANIDPDHMKETQLHKSLSEI